VKTLLEIGQQEMNLPVEIEFAVDMDVPEGQPYSFNFLQIRPIVSTDQSALINMDGVDPAGTILYSESALGNGEFSGIRDIIYVRPEGWDASRSGHIAERVEALNETFRKSQVQSPRVSQSESPQSESPQSESPQSESPQSESPQSESPQSESPQSESPQSESPQSTPGIEKGDGKEAADGGGPGKGYVLVGPGRWGSSDPWLGIPVKWSQISQARLIVESGLENYRIDPSQGTHFFQNLTSFRVGYMTINPFIGDGFYDPDYLDSLPAVYEDEFIRHIRFPENLEVRIDGRTNRGAVIKPA
jgi:hypothetical protein